MSKITKKVLFIDHDCEITGSTISLKYIINAFINAKYEVYVLTPKNKDNVKLLVENGAQTIPYGSRIIKSMAMDLHFSDEIDKTKYLYVFAKMIVKIFWGIYQTYKAIKKVKPDFVYINEYVAIQSAVAARYLRIPVVLHIRSQFVKGFLGLRRNILNKTIKYFTNLVFVISNEEKLQLKLPAKSVFVVREFLSDQDFKLNNSSILRERYKIFKESRIILTLGGITPIKGSLDFLRAADLIIPLNPNIVFIVAGKIEQGNNKKYDVYYSMCKEIFDKYPENIKILNYVKNPTELLSMCDILVAPFTESHFCRPIIEAMAHRKPTITTKLPHALEFIVHQENGIIVDVGDYKAISVWINELLNNTELSSQIAQRGQNIAYKLFYGPRNTGEIVKRCNAILTN